MVQLVCKTKHTLFNSFVLYILLFLINNIFIEYLLVHLNSVLGNSLIGTSLTLSGPAHLGGEPLNPLFLSHSENHARWQLQTNGLCTKLLQERNLIRFVHLINVYSTYRVCKDCRESNDPGITQVIWLLFSESTLRLWSPKNILLWISNNLFSDSNLNKQRCYTHLNICYLHNSYNSDILDAPSKEFSSIPVIWFLLKSNFTRFGNLPNNPSDFIRPSSLSCKRLKKVNY